QTRNRVPRKGGSRPLSHSQARKSLGSTSAATAGPTPGTFSGFSVSAFQRLPFRFLLSAFCFPFSTSPPYPPALTLSRIPINSRSSLLRRPLASVLRLPLPRL